MSYVYPYIPRVGRAPIPGLFEFDVDWTPLIPVMARGPSGEPKALLIMFLEHFVAKFDTGGRILTLTIRWGRSKPNPILT